ncbi:RDD family protein [Colwelliaceae bacterium 6441]
MASFDFTNFPRAGFIRRFASWVYDVLLSIAIFMIAAYLGIGILIGLDSLIDFNSLSNYAFIRIDADINWKESHVIYQLAFLTWSIAWVSYFFIFFWAKSGQTLGMKAWRLRLQNQDGSLITKATGLKRLIPTLLGLGNFWLLFDRKNKLSLQDKITHTEVVILSLEANRGRL